MPVTKKEFIAAVVVGSVLGAIVMHCVDIIPRAQAHVTRSVEVKTETGVAASRADPANATCNGEAGNTTGVSLHRVTGWRMMVCCADGANLTGGSLQILDCIENSEKWATNVDQSFTIPATIADDCATFSDTVNDQRWGDRMFVDTRSITGCGGGGLVNIVIKLSKEI